MEAGSSRDLLKPPGKRVPPSSGFLIHPESGSFPLSCDLAEHRMTEPSSCLTGVGLDQEACLDRRDVNGRVKTLKGDVFLYYSALLGFFQEELVSFPRRTRSHVEQM